MQDLKEIGAQAIAGSIETCNVIIIDEIGPMELFSEEFKEATNKALASSKPLLAVIHWKTSSNSEIRSRDDAETFVVSPENRNDLPKIIAQIVTEVLTQH